MSRGEASMEMTLALIGALLLLFGSVKIFLWLNERAVVRQQNYEATRLQAASGANPQVQWQEPSEKLEIFQ